MKKILLLISVALAVTLPVAISAQESLGDLARQLREQRSKATKKPSKVYTNDNLPARPPEEGPTAAAGISGGTSPSEPSAAQPAAPAGAEGAGGSGSKPDQSADKMKTKEFWQGRFKPLRTQLAKAGEDQQLAEDELNLLQIQRARELDPTAQAELDEKIKTKQAEVDAKRTATDKIKKDLSDLEKEFQESGAPAEWSKTD